jgi:copper chaperone CopZ
VAARAAVLELAGVVSVTVDTERKEALVVLDGSGARGEDVEKALAEAGFAPGKGTVEEVPPPPAEGPDAPP